LLLETKPEVVSFHFGLPDPNIVQATAVNAVLAIDEGLELAGGVANRVGVAALADDVGACGR